MTSPLRPDENSTTPDKSKAAPPIDSSFADHPQDEPAGGSALAGPERVTSSQPQAAIGTDVMGAGDDALAEEFARAPHQWALPAFGPTTDTELYRQVIGYLGPPPLRKPPRGLVAGCAVMVTLLMALVGLSGLYALRLARAQVSQRESAVSVAATIALFCEAAQNRDYSGAYRYLSASFQSQVPVYTFVAANETHDASDGAITSCTAQTDVLHTSITGNRVTVILQVTRSHTATALTTLVRGADGWRIDAIDPSLELD